MAKLDRLGWTTGFAFNSFGLRIGVRSNSVDIIEELQKRLPLGWQADSSPEVETIFSFKVGGHRTQSNAKNFHLAFCNFTRLVRTLDLQVALEAFETGIEFYVAETAQDFIFVHSGVVCWRGKAILIPGRSLSGKSTLVRELVKAGATYFSDEYAILDGEGRVYPYPLPIGVRNEQNIRQERYPIEIFGGKTGKNPIPVGLILSTKYRKGAHWTPKQISPAQGILTILSNTYSTKRNPARALSTLQQIVLKAPVLKGVRGETDEVVDALLNRPWPTL